MRCIFLLFNLAFLCSIAQAQWSDKTNLFTDSMHMPVCTKEQTQQHPMMIRSYPDSGYIVFWEDNRNTASTKQDIYAQKYNKEGKRLWKKDGVPVVKGPNNQHFFTSTNADYRNYSYAGTDSAGGFYIAYIDDSITNYSYYRICAQHILSNGKAVFADAGYIVAQSAGNNSSFANQQLIADGNKGFFISYIRDNDLFISCFKDEGGGNLKYYGGGQMNINAYEQQIGSCNNYIIAYRQAYVIDYMIYPDLQNGCNATMTLSQNAGGNDRFFTGFNRLIRVKKQSTTKTADKHKITYKKDTVLTYYKVYSHTYTFQCGNEIGTGYILESNGFLQTSNLTYEVAYSKGVVVPTDGNINADVFTFIERKYLNNTLTNWFTHAFYQRSEKYDSIPYNFTVFPYQPETYINTSNPQLNKFSYGNDTILYNGSVYPFDYCLATGGNKIYAAGRLLNLTFSHYDILLQQLQVVRKTADSFAVQFTTPVHNGVIVGKEFSSGFGSTSASFNDPQIVADNNGNAVFYIREYFRYVRVSPIINGTQLSWGAMGRATGSSAYNGTYYYPENPFIVADASKGEAALCWQDTRNYNGNTGINIFMRHLDSLHKAGYQPVYKPVKILPYSGGQANPTALLGSSKQYSLIEYFDGYSGYTSPVVEMLDKYNLGTVSINVYQNQGAIRNYNGKPYLDRNYTITPETNPKSSDKIKLRLFFTKAEFTALKAADASIHNPSDLAVIMQPYAAAAAPSAYTPVTGETKFSVQAYKAVGNGFYIEVQVKKFAGYMNYFVFPASVTLPLKQANVSVVDVHNKDTKTFIENLYPNPVTGNTIYIKTGDAFLRDMKVEILSADGKLLYHQDLSYKPQSIVINNITNGTYIMRITGAGKHVYTASFIKNDIIKKD